MLGNRIRTNARRYVAVAIALVAILGIGGVAGPAQALESSTLTGRVSQLQLQTRATASYDTKLIALINRARKARGIKPLKTTTKLAKAARKWSRQLAATENLRHDPRLLSSVSSAAGCSRLRAWGENVAYTSGSAASMFAMYMNSPGHRANILSRGFTHVGVGTLGRAQSWGLVHWNTMKFVNARCS